MIAQHRVGGHVDGEHACELFHPLDEPAAPMLETLAAVGVRATQKGTAHATADHVIPRRVGDRNQSGAGGGLWEGYFTEYAFGECTKVGVLSISPKLFTFNSFYVNSMGSMGVPSFSQAFSLELWVHDLFPVSAWRSSCILETYAKATYCRSDGGFYRVAPPLIDNDVPPVACRGLDALHNTRIEP